MKNESWDYILVILKLGNVPWRSVCSTSVASLFCFVSAGKLKHKEVNSLCRETWVVSGRNGLKFLKMVFDYQWENIVSTCTL